MAILFVSEPKGLNYYKETSADWREKALDEGNEIRKKIKWQQRNKSIGTEDEIKRQQPPN